MGTTLRKLSAAAIVAVVGSTASAAAAPSAAVGIISTFAGTGTSNSTGDGGPATAATLRIPTGIAIDGAGNVYVSDNSSFRVRKIAATTGVITTVAGNGLLGFVGDGGQATSARLFNPTGIAVTAAGDLFIVDQGNQRIRKVDAATGIITTIAGTGVSGFNGDGIPAISAQLLNPCGVAVDTAGNVYICDSNNRVRKVSAGSGIITSVAGPIISGVDVLSPLGIALADANTLYVYEFRRLLRIDLSSNTATVIAPSTLGGFDGENHLLNEVQFLSLNGLTADAAGNLYLSDSGRVRRVDAVTGLVRTVAGNGGPTPRFGDGIPATAAALSGPKGLAVDANGNLLIADSFSSRVRKVTPPAPTYFITTSAGNGAFGYSGEGTATAAALAHPSGIATDAAGNVYIGDSFNHRIRKVTPTGGISTIAGTGTATFGGDSGPATAAQLYHPEGLAFDRAGNLFVADSVNQRIRRITPAGIITTVAGNGIAGADGDGGPATNAKLFYPTSSGGQRETWRCPIEWPVRRVGTFGSDSAAQVRP